MSRAERECHSPTTPCTPGYLEQAATQFNSCSKMQHAASTGHAGSSSVSLLSRLLFTESYFGSKVTISSPVGNKPIYNTAVPLKGTLIGKEFWRKTKHSFFPYCLQTPKVLPDGVLSLTFLCSQPPSRPPLSLHVLM